MTGPGARAHVWQRAALGLGAALLASLLSLTPTWQALELKAYDLFTVLEARGTSALPIVILAIDEPSFQQLGLQWPFPRGLHAQVLQRLRADGAAAIAFDVVFADPSDPAQDALLAQSLTQSAPVVLASSRDKVENGAAALLIDVPPLPQLLQAGAVAGDATVDPDPDFVLRRMSPRDDSLPRQLARRVRPSITLPDPAQDLWLRYRGPRGTFDTRSYYQAVLPGLLPQGFFRGKIVLIGRSARTATELQHVQADLFNSPFALLGGERMMPGVELHATALDNLLTGTHLQPLPLGWSWLVMVLLLLPLSLLAPRWSALQGSAVALGACAGLVLGAWWLFHSGWWLAPGLPVSAVLLGHGTGLVLDVTRARRRTQQIRNMFAHYVPAEVVRRLVESPHTLRLGGETRKLTLMFTDLADFTTLSEQHTAEQTVAVLASHFEAMTPIIHAHGGTVDKFIGDAIMAFWGAPLDEPRHAELAVRCAIAMQQRMVTLRDELRARGLPPIVMRVGLHSGDAVVGNVGSAGRMAYTAVGDAVNLAARLEGANKTFGTGILLSQATAALLPTDIPLRTLDEITVKGKSQSVRVYTPRATDKLAEP